LGAVDSFHRIHINDLIDLSDSELFKKKVFLFGHRGYGLRLRLNLFCLALPQQALLEFHYLTCKVGYRFRDRVRVIFRLRVSASDCDQLLVTSRS